MDDVKTLIKEAESRIQRGKINIRENDIHDIRELHFELTCLCNEKCIMCDIWPRYKNNPEGIKEELTSEEIFKFVDKSEYLKKLELVLFSGGEPFLRKDLPDLCRYFISRYRQISIGILSNLFATDLILQKIKQILSYRPYRIWIGSSIDGIGDVHDTIRGVKGSFAALENSIDILKREYPQVDICLNFTLTTQNYRELEKVYNYAKDRNLNFSAQFAVPWDNTCKSNWRKEEFFDVRRSIYSIIDKMVAEYKEQKVRNIINEISGDHAKRQLLGNLFYWKGLIDYQEKPFRYFKHCVAGTRFVQISPTGDMYFCPLLKRKIIGNIRNTNYNFDSIWTSHKAVELREYINKGYCHCWLNCTIYPNIQYALEYNPLSFREKIVKYIFKAIKNILK